MLLEKLMHTTSGTSTERYDLETIKIEVYSLLERKAIALNQPLRILCNYMPTQSWNTIKSELELNDYLLRDRIIDLVGRIDWGSD